MTAYEKASVPDPSVAAIREKTEPEVPPALNLC